MAEPPLQKTEGTRVGSFIYYNNEHYVYLKESTYKEEGKVISTYFRCRKKTCSARIIWKVGQELCYSQQHNHIHEKMFLNGLKFKRKLCQRASTETIPLSAIYNQEQEAFPETALAIKSYNRTIRRMMEKARQKNLPGPPRNILDIDNKISDKRAEKFRIELGPEQRRFYGGLIQTDKDFERSVYFVSPTIKQIAATKKEWVLQMDGTFSVVPKASGIRQLFCIHLLYEGHVFPIMYCLMEKRTTSSYERVLKTLRSSILRNINITKIMTDYEASLRKALRNVFPNAELLGCWFHFAKAVYKRGMKLGFGRRSTKQTIKDGVRMAMALPLLPQNNFEEGIQTVHQWMESEDNKEDETSKIDQFCCYLRKWKNKNVSVYGQRFRTNNAVESFHNRLGQLVGKPHVSFWTFIEFLRKMEHKKACDATRVHRGEIITMCRRKKLERLETALVQEKNRFDADAEPDIGLFLRRISKIMKGEFQQCITEEEMDEKETEICA